MVHCLAQILNPQDWYSFYCPPNKTHIPLLYGWNQTVEHCCRRKSTKMWRLWWQIGATLMFGATLTFPLNDAWQSHLFLVSSLLKYPIVSLVPHLMWPVLYFPDKVEAVRRKCLQLPATKAIKFSESVSILFFFLSAKTEEMSLLPVRINSLSSGFYPF